MAILPALLTIILAWIPGAEAQNSGAATGLGAARARLLAPNGTVLAPAGTVTEIDVGTLTEADVPALLALAADLTGMPARTEVKLYAAIGGTPAKVQVERDKGGRLEVQIRGIPVASRARLLEIAETFLAKGGHDIRVEGPVAGRNMEARIRERTPEAIPGPAALLPPPSPSGAVATGPPAELHGRWRSTTLAGAVLVLRATSSGLVWEYEAPRGGGLVLGMGPVQADGTGAANAEAIALTGRITRGDETPGRSSNSPSSISFTLRREGAALRGTARGSRDLPIRCEFVKDGTP